MQSLRCLSPRSTEKDCGLTYTIPVSGDKVKDGARRSLLPDFSPHERQPSFRTGALPFLHQFPSSQMIFAGRIRVLIKGSYHRNEHETGMSRLALSDADKSARDWFVETTQSLGCAISIDAMVQVSFFLFHFYINIKLFS